MISNSYEEIRNRLTAENEFLREALASMQRELLDILEQKKELFFRRRRIELGDENRDEFEFSQTNLLNLKKDLFAMPTQGVSYTIGTHLIHTLRLGRMQLSAYRKI